MAQIAIWLGDEPPSYRQAGIVQKESRH